MLFERNRLVDSAVWRNLFGESILAAMLPRKENQELVSELLEKTFLYDAISEIILQ